MKDVDQLTQKIAAMLRRNSTNPVIKHPPRFKSIKVLNPPAEDDCGIRLVTFLSSKGKRFMIICLSADEIKEEA